MNRERYIWIIERGLRGIVLIFLLTMSIPHTAALQSILIALSVLGMVARAILQKQFPTFHTPFDFAIFIYTAVILLKSILSIDPGYSTQIVRNELLLQLLIFYLTITVMNNSRYINRLATAMLISMFFVAGIGLIGYFQGSLVKHSRAVSYFGSFGRAAFYVSMIFPIALGKFFFTRKWLHAVIFGLLIATSIGFMLVTLSRGAWISTLAALFLLTALKDRRMIIVLLIAIILVPWFLPTNVLDRVISIFQVKHWESNHTLGDRLWLWRSALDMIRDRPWLGAGYGNRIFYRLYPDYIYSHASGTIFYNAHNLYLQLIIETGIIGLLTFLGIVGTALILILKLLMKHPAPDEEGLLLGITGSLTVFLLFSFTTFRYEHEIGFLFWFMLGMIAGMYIRYRDKRV